jgi:alpha-ketoglutarate-dependent taurine dioxygenase
MRIAGVSDTESLLALASSLGSPIPSPTGEPVKRLSVASAIAARPGTLSATHGAGEFPLHTDTAFWLLPARYIILRAYGDIRRHTVVSTFAEVTARCGAGASCLIEKSVWVIRTPRSSFYCGMRFRHRGCVGLRYDGNCMFPANRAAREVQQFLEQAQMTEHRNKISWEANNAVVISNWVALHGRGPEPDCEGERILERVYVR